MKIEFIERLDTQKQSGTLVLGVAENGQLLNTAKEFDTMLNGQLTKAATKANFKGKKGETLKILAPASSSYDQIILVGCADLQKLTLQTLKEIGASLCSSVLNEKTITVALSDLQKNQSISNGEAVANIASGFELRNFKFNKYKTKKDPQNPEVVIENLTFVTADPKEAKARYDVLKAQRESVFKGVIPYLKKANELDPKNEDVSKTLLGVYKALEMTAEAKALKATM